MRLSRTSQKILTPGRLKVGLQYTGMIQDPGFDLYFHPIISLYVKVDICDIKTLTNSVKVTHL